MSEERLRRLIRVGRSLLSELDVDAVLRRVLEASREITGARYAALGVLDESRAGLARFLSVGIDAPTRHAIGEPPQGRGVLGVLVSDPLPLRLDEIGSHPRSFGFPPGHPPMSTFLGVPILIRDEAWGNLYLAEKRGGFDDRDEESVIVLAGWAAIAIDNARIHRRVRGRRDELERAVRAFEATTEIARAVAGETRLPRVVELVVKRGRAVVDARSMVLMLLEGERLTVAAVAGDVEPDLLGEDVDLRDSIAGHALRTRRPQSHRDLSGALRHPFRSRLAARSGIFVPLVFRGREIGVLAGFELGGGADDPADEERIMRAFATAAASAIATARSVEAHVLRRSIDASERERRRWARELHDQTLQDLAGLRLLLGAARRSGDERALRDAVGHALEEIDNGVRELRELITDLRPAALDEFGAEPALAALAERVTKRTGVAVTLDVDLAYEQGREPARPAPQLEATLYRVVQEALTNAVKHAEAGEVRVEVLERAGTVRICVRDDGRGFDPSATTEGFGLLGMRERLELAGGSLQVQSAPGEGTLLEATLPATRRDDPVVAAGARRAAEL